MTHCSAERLEPLDVRAEVELGRRQPVARGRGAAGRSPAARRSRPTQYASDGSPNGVRTFFQRTSSSPSIS